MTRPKARPHHWEFTSRFGRGAFGWKSQPAIQRVRQAVSEIKKVARRDPVLAAEGAVMFLERVSPALEHVDSSSGAISTAVNHAIEGLVAIIAKAPVDTETREGWLERLWEAHANDEIPYIERLGDFWGELCASPEIASPWADRLVRIVEMAWNPDPELHGFFHGTTACLSALLRAGRYEAILALLEKAPFPWWTYRQWGVRALAAPGRPGEAIRLANRAPCDPKTLTRAARDFADERREFAVEAGLAALRWLVEGYGYEITDADVWAAYANTMKAAQKAGRVGEVRDRIRTLVGSETYGERFVTRILGRELGL